MLTMSFGGFFSSYHSVVGTKGVIWLPSKLRLDNLTCKTSAVQLCVTETLLQRILTGLMSTKAVSFVLCSQSLKCFPQRTQALEEVQAIRINLCPSQGREKQIYRAHIRLLCSLKLVTYSSTATLSRCQTAQGIRRVKRTVEAIA